MRRMKQGKDKITVFITNIFWDKKAELTTVSVQKSTHTNDHRTIHSMNSSLRLRHSSFLILLQKHKLIEKVRIRLFYLLRNI